MVLVSSVSSVSSAGTAVLTSPSFPCHCCSCSRSTVARWHDGWGEKEEEGRASMIGQTSDLVRSREVKVGPRAKRVRAVSASCVSDTETETED
jgi:hypothetical protein